MPDRAEHARVIQTTPDVQLLRVDVDHPRGVPVVRVVGEIDMSTASTLGERLSAAFEDAAADASPEAPRPVVVDLSGVGFLGSVGLALLVEYRERGIDRGTPMNLVVSSRAVLRSLQATQLDALLAVHPTLDDALSAVSGS
ncbi:STAS domain-containing protein [Umezawaea beigongshangensis]|uniref:STAS domain-containing protein n=1 Tax=Umezawaea beigongshangensis TaxID=2780383 RepID=UPI001E3DEBBA|nr:STAS domain-containing protein [Umezawaea beigongshangensis]